MLNLHPKFMATPDQPRRDLPEVEFRRFWQRLQSMGLNAYEARSYLVLVGHPRFKALELAARAHVPRQKIYEVLDSLVEKGFAQVIQEKTKLFSAVPPDQAIPSYLVAPPQALEQQLADQAHAAQGMVDELMAAYSEGQGGRGTLDYLRIVSDPGQIASQFRRMLADARVGVSGIFAPALRRRSARCRAGDSGARARRELPRAGGTRNARRRACSSFWPITAPPEWKCGRSKKSR